MKKRFAETYGVPTDQQQWSFAGTSLNDDSTFFDYNIEKESTLFVELKMLF
jgi:hypothetical protein